MDTDGGHRGHAFDRGLHLALRRTDHERMESHLEEPYILHLDRKIVLVQVSCLCSSNLPAPASPC